MAIAEKFDFDLDIFATNERRKYYFLHLETAIKVTLARLRFFHIFMFGRFHITKLGEGRFRI